MKYIHEKNRIYLLDEQENMVAEVDFPPLDPNTVVITHTFVDLVMRGKGVASELIQLVYDDVKPQNKMVKATCPYAVKWFEENPDKQDILVD